MTDATQYQIAIGSMALFITGLFAYLRTVDARQQKQIKWLIQKWGECEEDRNALRDAIIDLGGHVRLPVKRRSDSDG